MNTLPIQLTLRRLLMSIKIKSLPAHVQARFAIGNAAKSKGFESATLENGQKFKNKEELWNMLSNRAKTNVSGNGIKIKLNF